MIFSFLVLIQCLHLTYSVSSFVRKTTEKIGTLHGSPDRIRQDIKDEEQLPEMTARLAQPQEEGEEDEE